MDEHTCLSEHQPGAILRVQEISGESDISIRLLELGLVTGTVLRIVKRAPLGEPIEIKFRGSHLALRLDEAANVLVTEASE